MFKSIKLIDWSLLDGELEHNANLAVLNGKEAAMLGRAASLNGAEAQTGKQFQAPTRYI